MLNARIICKTASVDFDEMTAIMYLISTSNRQWLLKAVAVIPAVLGQLMMAVS
jgi:hypothetical protein